MACTTRVFSYIRKSSNIKPFQVAADLFRDSVQIMISPWDEAVTGLTTLLNCTDTPYFICGDFNLRHPLWDLKIDHLQATCQALGSLPDVYKIFKWHNSAQKYQSLLLHDDDD
ncbi:hypothetical protein EPUL_004624, partial [Erysiphe pulchra]